MPSVSFLRQLSDCRIASLDTPISLRISAVFLIATLGLLWVRRQRVNANKSLPPSPPKHWFWGNKKLLNQPHRHVQLGTEYKRALGDIISLTTPFETVVVVNTMELATELLDKQAAVTSNRPRNVMVQEILGWDTSTGFSQHNEWHKKLRRVLASALHPTAARSYAAQHLETTLDLLYRISETPDAFEKHTNDVVGEFIMQMTYGYKVVENDPLLVTVRRAFAQFAESTSVYYLVNDFPILKHLPAWFPGANFQVVGKEGRELRDRYANETFNIVFDQVRNNSVERPSYTSRLLEAKGGVNATEDDIELVKWTAGSMFTAGSTTTVGAVLTFILFAALYPEAAKIARTEIDTVVGRDRIPELKDRESMPYVEALLQEVMRVCPVAPMGLAHATTEDVELGGYRIPKNTTLYANIWAMLRDPNHFPSPNVFDPTRFLKPTPDSDPRKYIFGFGRRVCPGSHVANNSAWIMCAGILSVFDLQAGPELLAKVEALGGLQSEHLYKLFKPYLVSDPLPFPCKLTPRDQAAVALLENAAR